MQTSFYQDSTILEIALDEAGRGPLFGRVYAAAVILPTPNEEEKSRPCALHSTDSCLANFRFDFMKDSKKIKSKKKMKELSDYIKQHAIAYSIAFEEVEVIDRINILQADMSAMHKAIKDVVGEMRRRSGAPELTHERQSTHEHVQIIVDGNYFTPYTEYNHTKEEMITYAHTTVEQGDAKYCHIAAASILAKQARDEYILSLCEEYPELKTKYHLHTNMGYGTKQHLEGIRMYGITPWHRKSFGPCKAPESKPKQETKSGGMHPDF